MTQHLRLVGVVGPLPRERALELLWPLTPLRRCVDTPLLCSDTNVGEAGAAMPCEWDS